MICPDCEHGIIQARITTGSRHDTGLFPRSLLPDYQQVPCPTCNGSGIAYCCTGEDYNAKPQFDATTGDLPFVDQSGDVV